MSECLVLITDPAHAFGVLAPLERKGFTLVGLKIRGPQALIAIRGPEGLCSRGGALCESLRSVLPAGAPLEAATSLTESLELLHAAFGPKELVQWEAEDEEEAPCEWVRPPAPALLGAHGSPAEAIWLSELIGAGVGSPLGVRFCAQLRRDGYARLLLGPEQQALYGRIEEAASRWFTQGEEAKEAQAGVYAHVNRKFTGYRNGKYREQLELRQTRQGSLYPQAGPGGAPNERIGLPFLFRGRSDAVLNTSSAIAAAKAAGRPSHLAEMETTTIKELPAFDSAKSILRNWRLHGVPPKGWAVEK